MQHQIRVVFIVFLVSIFVLTACNTNSTSNLPQRLQDIQKAGKLLVGTALTRPFQYHDETTNELVGFDIDLMNAIAKRLNVTVEWRELAFADLLSELNAGKVDMVIAAMYITPARLDIADFSQPYLDTGLVMVVQANDTTIKEFKDLAGKKVGVKIQATGERWADDLRNNQKIDMVIQRYENTIDSLNELNDGVIDAIFNDKLNTLEYMKTHSNIKIQGEVFDPAGLGISVRKGDTDLLNHVNTTLNELKASGEITTLFDKWFK